MKIVVKTRELKALLRRLGRLGQTGDAAVLAAGKKLRLLIVLDSLNQQKTPMGAAWPRLKKRRGVALRDTGKLREIQVNPRGRNSVAVGPWVDYAQYHQQGGKNNRRPPRRAFLPITRDGNVRWPAKWKTAIFAKLRDGLEREIKRVGN